MLGKKLKKDKKQTVMKIISITKSKIIQIYRKEYNFIAHDHIAYRFEILAIIGKGSYGQVFRIFDHKKKEELALKMIKNRPKFTKQAFIEIQILTHIK